MSTDKHNLNRPTALTAVISFPRLALLAGLLLSAICAVSPAQATSFTNWDYRMKITFTGYDKSETLTNFPALVIPSEDLTDFYYSQFASTNGYDLRFMDGSESTVLNYEIEDWGTNTNSYVWVQVQAFTNDCWIWAYWGNTNATSAPPVYATNGAAWSNDFAAVWHMSETDAEDSTTNANDSTANNNTNAAGLVDGAQGLDGVGDFLRVGDNASLDITDAITLSAWVKPRAVSGYDTDFRTILSKDSYDKAPYGFFWDSPNEELEFLINDDSSRLTLSYDYTDRVGLWTYVVATYDRSDMRIYANGTELGSLAETDALITDTADVYIGRDETSSKDRYFKGFFDEMRISSVARSSNWIWACWMNVASNNVFGNYGLVQYLPTINNTNGATTVTYNSATLNGTLTSTGGAPTQVWVYWGTNNADTVKDNWGNTNYFGINTAALPASCSTNVTGLTGETTYYYRFYASNTIGGAWADTVPSFTTLESMEKHLFKMKIIFTDYDKPETLTNFPALVKFDETLIPSFDYDQMGTTNAADLRFMNSNETTALNYEIEEWDTNDTSFVWVQVPTISGTNTYIWAYWGNVDKTNPPVCTTNGSTWSSPYIMVQHLNETSDTHYDSTTNENNGANVNSTQDATGKIDGANDFNGSTAYVQVSDDNTLSFGDGATTDNPFSVSAWAKMDDASDFPVLSKGPDSAIDANLEYLLSTRSDDTLRMRLYDNAKGQAIYRTSTATLTSLEGQWVFLAATYDGTGLNGMKIYLNGEELGGGNTEEGTYDEMHNGTEDVRIGSFLPGNATDKSFADGLIDEARISDMVRSSNWVWACWMNAASNTTFNTCQFVIVTNYIYVVDGASGGGDGTVTSPFNSIRDAIEEANDNLSTNNIIYVGAGTFNDTDEDFTADGTLIVSNRSLQVYGGFADANSLRSWQCTDTYGTGTRTGTTTIDLGDICIGMLIETISTNTVINGFTIKDGTATTDAWNGNAIWAKAKCSLSHLDLVSNDSWDDDRDGGAIYFTSQADYSVIEYSSIRGNSVYSSGTVYIPDGANNILIANCIFSGNNVNSGSAGIYTYSTPLTVFGCLFYENTMDGGDGVALRMESSGDITYFINNTVADNETDAQHAYYHLNGSSYIRNNIFSDNGTSAQGIKQNGTDGTVTIGVLLLNNDVISAGEAYTDEGGITTNAPAFTDSAADDYTLTEASPVVNNGSYLISTDSTILGGGGSETVKFVDVDNNGSYTALRDIIVDLGGYNASGKYATHHIYTTDRVGFMTATDLAARTPKARVIRDGIDLGCYEFVIDGANAGFLFEVE